MRSEQSKRLRIADLDNLRSFLTALVVIHHTAIPYGGLGSWAFRSACSPAVSLPLATFNGVNQTFFMGTFFFISGWFSGMSMISCTRRKRYWPFLRSRILRLLFPTIIFTLFVDPGMDVMRKGFGAEGYVWQNGFWDNILISWSTVLDCWVGIRGVRGPVWYCALLVIFDFTLTGLVILTDSKKANVFGSYYRTLTFWGFSVAASFSIRLIYPVGTTFEPLNLQLAFLPQYLLAYGLGSASSAAGDLHKHQLFDMSRQPFIYLLVSLSMSTLTLGIVSLVATVLDDGTDPSAAIDSLGGGFSFPAFLYAVWNESSFAVLMPALLCCFSRHLNHPLEITLGNGKAINLARYAYAAFLAHPPISLAIELLFDAAMECSAQDTRWGNYSLWPILMTATVGILNVASSWTAGFVMVECLPVVGRIV